MDSIIVFVAKYFLFLSLVIVGVYWLLATKPIKISLAWKMVVGGLLALLMAKIGAHFYYDTRPFVAHHIKPMFPHAADNGFPSDHALLTSLIGFTMLAYSRRLGGLLLLNAVLVGAARVAAHVHSPIDIIGSFVFSAASVLIVLGIERLLVKRGAHARR